MPSPPSDFHASDAHPSRTDQRIAVHFGSLEALQTFLAHHEAQEVYLKTIVSPTETLRGEYVRHFGMCVSACISTVPGTPIAYCTFLAATLAQAGNHGHLLYPARQTIAALKHLTPLEAAQQLQRSLFLTLQKILQDQERCQVFLDAQWDIHSPWAGLAKGLTWNGTAWEQHEAPTTSLFWIP